METDDTDEQVAVYFRRPILAMRMLKLGGRPKSVRAWSGLTAGQFKTVRKRSRRPTRRMRYSHKALFNSSIRRSHAALFISFCEFMKVIGTARGPEAAARLPSLTRGERMCATLALFRRWAPEAQMDFEYGSQLVLGVVHGEALRMAQCSCRAAMLVDLRGAPRSACSFCQPRAPGPRAWGKHR